MKYHEIKVVPTLAVEQIKRQQEEHNLNYVSIMAYHFWEEDDDIDGIDDSINKNELTKNLFLMILRLKSKIKKSISNRQRKWYTNPPPLNK